MEYQTNRKVRQMRGTLETLLERRAAGIHMVVISVKAKGIDEKPAGVMGVGRTLKEARSEARMIFNRSSIFEVVR